ncbi:MAG: UDP-N-acetylmuramoyl-tripeptide--D-alanyl-D-alanine ligase [Erysipelothrix sp.]|nr:UDP-N-acetylmuramoyl-tripeptide--D-alanyl-D-alanine ligase [Erysipelothrix sp.]
MTLILVFATLNLIIPTKQALHMFQQNRYETTRYTIWLKTYVKQNGKTIIKVSFIVLAAFLSGVFISKYIALVIMELLSMSIVQNELKQTYIKPLVYTARVKRQILTITLIYLLIILVITGFGFHASMYFLLASPFISYGAIYLMSMVTAPIERSFQHLFKQKAKDILSAHTGLIKVGITGSYGKTSSKNIVNEIVSNKFYTLSSPASFNTPMGLTITIREHLKNTHALFIAEMGADKVGDIVELSELIKPDIAIVTSIGPQHLMTFKSLENIINEKMSLVEHLPQNGLAILNKDNEYIKNYHIKNNIEVKSYGIQNKDVDYFASNIEYSIKGSTFIVHAENKEYAFSTRLLGEHNVSNILSGIALGRHLNLDWILLQQAVSSINYVEHRLELKKINNRMFIDNAFNSNPAGAAMSLQVLKKMPYTRWIITPGLIDLGMIQDEENYKFGQRMINHVDHVLLVGKHQTEAIYKGLKDSHFNMDNVIVFNTVKEALAYVYAHTREDDIILLENDLPDAFNN